MLRRYVMITALFLLMGLAHPIPAMAQCTSYTKVTIAVWGSFRELEVFLAEYLGLGKKHCLELDLVMQRGLPKLVQVAQLARGFVTEMGVAPRPDLLPNLRYIAAFGGERKVRAGFSILSRNPNLVGQTVGVSECPDSLGSTGVKLAILHIPRKFPRARVVCIDSSNKKEQEYYRPTDWTPQEGTITFKTLGPAIARLPAFLRGEIEAIIESYPQRLTVREVAPDVKVVLEIDELVQPIKAALITSLEIAEELDKKGAIDGILRMFEDVGAILTDPSRKNEIMDFLAWFMDSKYNTGSAGGLRSILGNDPRNSKYLTEFYDFVSTTWGPSGCFSEASFADTDLVYEVESRKLLYHKACVKP